MVEKILYCLIKIKVETVTVTVYYDLPQGKQLMQNQDKGIVMSTQSLVLQKVGRMSRGEYECQAVNSEGTTTSNPVNLNIMCKKIFYIFWATNRFVKALKKDWEISMETI